MSNFCNVSFAIDVQIGTVVKSEHEILLGSGYRKRNSSGGISDHFDKHWFPGPQAAVWSSFMYFGIATSSNI